jgi:hypothetical protein
MGLGSRLKRSKLEVDQPGPEMQGFADSPAARKSDLHVWREEFAKLSTGLVLSKTPFLLHDFCFRSCKEDGASHYRANNLLRPSTASFHVGQSPGSTRGATRSASHIATSR